MTDKNYFNSDDLYNTMEVPAVNRPRPSTADKIDDPWKLSGDGQTDEVLEFISRKLAEREKAREEAKKAEAESLIKKDSTMVMPKTEASDETELVSDSVATDDTMLIPEVKQGEVSEEKPTDETMVIPEISVSEDTVLIPEVEPTEAVTEITDDTVVIEAVEAAPERSAVSDDTIIMKKLPAIGLGQRIVSNETTAVVKKVEPKAEDNFPPDIPDDELFPEFDPFFEDDKPEENDPDATQLIPVVSAEEKPADDGRVVVKLDGPEDKIERAPAPKGRLWPPVLISSLVLIVACFVTLALGVMPVLVQNGFAKGVTQIITPVLTAGQPAANTNVLLMGVDKDGYRTDTMMVATYNVETSQITVMQLPRDTYVKNNGRQDKKLNSAYFTGVDQLKKEVNLAYGIKIHKYVEVNIDAFKKLIDAIGGVQMDVPINMIYDDPYQNLHIYLLKGPQVLDGEKAEQFVRFRKNNDGSGYPRGDLQRLEAQQAFITATVKQIVSGDGLKNINKLIKIALENVNTDMSFNEIYDYCTSVLTAEQEIQFMEAPGYAANLAAGSYFIVDYEGAKNIAQTYFYATQEDIAKMNSVVVKQETTPAPAPAPADTSAAAEPEEEEEETDEEQPPEEEQSSEEPAENPETAPAAPPVNLPPAQIPVTAPTPTPAPQEPSPEPPAQVPAPVPSADSGAMSR